MPYLVNPSGVRLACYRLGRFLEAGERVEITEHDAVALSDSTVFVVERPSAAPKRETVRRGSKRVETTKAPKRETRG